MNPLSLLEAKIKPGSETTCFSFFMEEQIAKTEQQIACTEFKAKPVEAESKGSSAKVKAVHPLTEKKERNGAQKIEAKKQQERRKIKAQKGLVRIESYIPREIGELVRARARLAGVTCSVVIKLAVVKFLSSK